MTGSQIRQARRLLDWDAVELARRSRIGRTIIVRAERAIGEAPVTVEQAQAIRSALEAAGVEFTTGDAPGVRMGKATG